MESNDFPSKKEVDGYMKLRCGRCKIKGGEYK